MSDCYEQDQTKHVDVLLFILSIAKKDVLDAAPSQKEADVDKWTVDDVTIWMDKIGLG